MINIKDFRDDLNDASAKTATLVTHHDVQNLVIHHLNVVVEILVDAANENFAEDRTVCFSFPPASKRPGHVGIVTVILHSRLSCSAH